jgi:hypothetical protein
MAQITAEQEIRLALRGRDGRLVYGVDAASEMSLIRAANPDARILRHQGQLFLKTRPFGQIVGVYPCDVLASRKPKTPVKGFRQAKFALIIYDIYPAVDFGTTGQYIECFAGCAVFNDDQKFKIRECLLEDAVYRFG